MARPVGEIWVTGAGQVMRGGSGTTGGGGVGSVGEEQPAAATTAQNSSFESGPRVKENKRTKTIANSEANVPANRRFRA
jgi:hypothetical protein